MFISPSPLTLSSTVSTSGTTSGNTHSTRAFLGSLPLSTLPDPPPDQSSALSYISSLPRSRSPPPSEFSWAMPPAGRAGHLGLLDVINPSNPSASSMDTGASTGTSPSPSSAFGSNTDVSASLTSQWTTSSTIVTSPWAISSSSSLFLSIDPSSMSELTPTFNLPSPTALTTQTPMPSYSSTYTASSPSPSSMISSSSTLFSTSTTTQNPSAIATTVISSITVVTSVSLPSLSPLNSPSTSTYTMTSVFMSRGGTTTDFVTSSSVLSTQSAGSTVDSTFALSPGAITAIVLALVAAFIFAVLWLFCARKRQNKLVREATLAPSPNHASGPLGGEVSELGYGIRSAHGAGSPTSLTGPVMEERYAGILAALHSTEAFGRCSEGGSTGGIYGSRHDTATGVDENDDGTRASSPTLAHHANLLDDPQYIVPLSPPPHVLPSYHQTSHPAPPPSAYYLATRRKSSPDPDSTTWLGGYSIAPSCNSHYARSQTLGSGSLSGSVDALSRTRTGSEEPLLGVGKVAPEASACFSPLGSISLATTADTTGNKPGLGSAFGSPPSSVYSPSGVCSALQYDTSGSYGTRSASGSGPYVYASSGAPNSFDALRKVSSQGALSSAYSHGHGQSQGFKFGFSRVGSFSSSSTGKRPGGSRHSFRVPPTSFRARKDRGLTTLGKEKQGDKQSVREKDWKQKTRSTNSVSTAESVEEKQGRGSPVGGVRALLERLRRAGHTPSPHSSIKDLPSPTRASIDVDPELGAVDRTTSPPIQIQVATPRRPRRFSFVLSNPDPHPPSPYSGAGEVIPSPHASPRPVQHDVPTGDAHDCTTVPVNAEGLQPRASLATGYTLVHAPSPAPTEESRLAEGLLHPRLQTQGYSDASLRDFEDYSRPIAGVVKNRLYSTTTFGTQESEMKTPTRAATVLDEQERENEAVDVFGTSMFRDVPRDSWFFEDLTPSVTALHSPIRD